MSGFTHIGLYMLRHDAGWEFGDVARGLPEVAVASECVSAVYVKHRFCAAK